MKKYAVLCVFVLGLIFSTQINAQEKIKIKEVAVKKVESFKQIMDISSAQQHQLLDLYFEFESNKQNVASTQARDGVQKLRDERSLEEKLESQLQNILNKKQYILYKQHQKKLLYEKSKM